MFKKNFPRFLLALFCLFSFLSLDIHAAYIQVYSGNQNGQLSFTGNTLGLNGKFKEHEAGDNGNASAFITTNTLLQVPTFAAGSTLDWHLNSSTAILDIPSGSTILYAELIWSGSFGVDPAISGAVLNTPVTFITPDLVSHSVAPNPATAQSNLFPNFAPGGFYVRSADVTSLVTGQGTYEVGGVPATMVEIQGGTGFPGNAAGWTLAVAYQNPNCFSNNLTIYVACEGQSDPAAAATGFQTPLSGAFNSRVFLSAIDGDPHLDGDSCLVGSTPILSYPANAISGSFNPLNNFFASQINTLLPLTIDISTGKIVQTTNALQDTRGTHGLLNSIASPPTGVAGARQGYDITSISLNGILTNGQTALYVDPISSFDEFTVNSLGLQIQISSPVLTITKQALPVTVGLNSIVTYTLVVQNTGDQTASSIIFTDPLPTGLTFVPGSFTLNAVSIPAANIATGVPIGSLAPAASATITFQAQVTQISPPSSFDNVGYFHYSFTPVGSLTPINVSSQSNIVTITAAVVPPPVANPDTGITNANVTLNATTVLVNDTGTSISVSTFDPLSVQGGSVMMLPDGTYTYTPPLNFSGTDTFNYTIQDFLGQTSSTTVTITVLPLANADSASVAANTPLNQLISVLNNDIGTGISVTNSDVVSTEGGTVAVAPGGTYLYNPPLNFSGVDSFNYTITDSIGNTSSTVVNILVLPAAQDDFGVTPANVTLNGTTVFTNDQGQGLTIIAYDPVSVAGGQVTMNTTTGTYVYVPPLNFSGLDTFTYTVQDQLGNTDVATVRITVLPVAVDDTGATLQNVPLNQVVSVLNNDAGTGLTVVAFDPLSIQGGTVVMQPNGTYLYTPPLNFNGSDSFRYTAQDTIGNNTIATVVISVGFTTVDDMAFVNANSVLNGASVLSNDTGVALTVIAFQNPSTQGGTVAMNIDGTYTYIPPLNYSGQDTFTYTARDAFGNTSTATVHITVLPLAGNVFYSTMINTALNGSTVLANSVGTNLSVLAYQAVSANGGTVVLNTVTGTFVYNPPLNFVGTDSFQFTVQDGAGSTAVATAFIDVSSLFPPTNFKGLLRKNVFLNKTEYCLVATWTPSTTEDIQGYRIYHNGKLVARIPASGPYVYKVSLKSKHAAQGYQIAAVGQDGTVSDLVDLKIKYES